MNVISFTTNRRHGHARAPGALARLLRARRLSPGPATAEQTHGTRLAWVKELKRETRHAGVDGLLTTAVNQPLAIFTADCLPVFLSAPAYSWVGLLHAGWRGVRGKILEKAVRSARQRLGCASGQISLWTGPAIGPCCFEVKWDVARYFPSSRRRRKDRWSVDLDAEIKRQARALGLRLTPRPGEGTCTMHDSRFYSYRRDATANRQVSVILMKGR